MVLSPVNRDAKWNDPSWGGPHGGDRPPSWAGFPDWYINVLCLGKCSKKEAQGWVLLLNADSQTQLIAQSHHSISDWFTSYSFFLQNHWIVNTAQLSWTVGGPMTDGRKRCWCMHDGVCDCVLYSVSAVLDHSLIITLNKTYDKSTILLMTIDMSIQNKHLILNCDD